MWHKHLDYMDGWRGFTLIQDCRYCIIWSKFKFTVVHLTLVLKIQGCRVASLNPITYPASQSASQPPTQTRYTISDNITSPIKCLPPSLSETVDLTRSFSGWCDSRRRGCPSWSWWAGPSGDLCAETGSGAAWYIPAPLWIPRTQAKVFKWEKLSPDRNVPNK